MGDNRVSKLGSLKTGRFAACTGRRGDVEQ